MTYIPRQRTDDEIRQITRLKRRATFGTAMAYSTVITFIAGLALVFGGITYVSANNRKWCDIITTFTQSWDTEPPTTDSGKALAERMNELQTRLGCE